MENPATATPDHSLPPDTSNGTARPGAPGPDGIRRQLQRILASRDFPASERNRRFLAHVIERTLRGETVRGYEIGTLVFGRPKSFNATGDPIVRIEAGKLRRDLETYYLKSGKHDQIRISLPKGAYRANFSYAETPVAGGALSRGSLTILRAALIGWAGTQAEATAAWRTVVQEFPDFALNPQAHKALDLIHANDDRIRELLLEGLRRAARSGHDNLAERDALPPRLPSLLAADRGA